LARRGRLAGSDINPSLAFVRRNPNLLVHRSRKQDRRDASRQDLGSESFEIGCQPNDTEWFRWHTPAGMKYYRYIFY